MAAKKKADSSEPVKRESRVERLARELEEARVADIERRRKRVEVLKTELAAAERQLAKSQDRVAKLRAEVAETDPDVQSVSEAYATLFDVEATETEAE